MLNYWPAVIILSLNPLTFIKFITAHIGRG